MLCLFPSFIDHVFFTFRVSLAYGLRLRRFSLTTMDWSYQEFRWKTLRMEGKWHRTLVQNNREFRRKHWATSSSACTAHSFIHAPRFARFVCALYRAHSLAHSLPSSWDSEWLPLGHQDVLDHSALLDWSSMQLLDNMTFVVLLHASWQRVNKPHVRNSRCTTVEKRKKNTDKMAI